MFAGQIFVHSARLYSPIFLQAVRVHLLHSSSYKAVGVGVVGYVEVSHVQGDVVTGSNTLPFLVVKP